MNLEVDAGPFPLEEVSELKEFLFLELIKFTV
jgi:hypothetical protein